MTNVTVDPAAPGEDLIVNVGKGGRIDGTVLGDDGRPKANSIVSAMGGMADFSARLSAVTDDQGRYNIENVAAGTYNVSSLSVAVSDDDDEEQQQPGRRFGGLDSVSTDVKDGQTSTVNFGEKKIKVSGVVKKKQGETSGLIVVFTAMGSSGAPMAAKVSPTDETGHYEVTLPGSTTSASGIRDARSTSRSLSPTPPPSATTSGPRRAISGRSVDFESGSP